MELQYRDPERVALQEAIEVFRTRRVDETVRTLLGMSLNGQNLDFVLSWCLFFLGHVDDRLAGAAAVSIGHLARVHRHMNTDVVIPALEMVRDEGRIAGQVGDALEDISLFCSKPSGKTAKD
jgi:hypothetical protein